MTTSTPEKQDGLKALNQAITKIEEVITSMGGVFTIQMAVSRVAIRSAHSFPWSKQVWFAVATSGIMILNQQRGLWDKTEKSIQLITVLTAVCHC